MENCEFGIDPVSISKFDKWFEENQQELESLLSNDQYELLYRAWAAGYGAGVNSMSDIMSELSWIKNPDRSGGQFTDEEIKRSERGGDGW